MKLTVNPVLSRELRQRMRGPRSSIVLTLFLLLLSAAVWLLYEGASQVADGSDGPDVEQIAALGRGVFQTLLFVILMLVCFIVPGQTAAAIAGERERQTLVPLQVTMLRSRSILFGKLLASLAFVGLLIVASVPLVGVAFMLGGVEPFEVLRATAMLLVVATALAAIALLCSTVARRTQGATVLAYAVVLAMTVGSFIAFGAQATLSRGDDVEHQAVLQLNPFMAVASVLDSRADRFSGSSLSPFSPMQQLIRQRDKDEFEEVARQGEVRLGPDGVMEQGGRDDFIQRRSGPRGLNTVPFAVFALLGYAGVIAGSLAISTYRLHVPRLAP